jgi:hypothetical protein
MDAEMTLRGGRTLLEAIELCDEIGCSRGSARTGTSSTPRFGRRGHGASGSTTLPL